MADHGFLNRFWAVMVWVLADNDAYGRYLRQIISSCLPAGLVEVVEQRPSDPIQYLAMYLYTYRRQRPLQLPDDPELRLMFSEVQTTDSLSRQQQERELQGSHLFSRSQTTSPFEDLDKDYIRQRNSEVTVHLQMCEIFKDIGDIFDDEDLL